jgi:FAD/FMN-containing dehydrogenase
LHRYGWGITAGDTRSVGVGGLTLGGGMGWLVRKYGLALDSVVGAEVVLADGRVVRAAADEHPDLFWALRGGGGNFGVVLSLDFIAQPITSVHFGTISLALTDVPGLVRGWREVMRAADENLSSTLALVPPMMGRPASAMVLCCYAEPDEAAAAAALKPLRALGSVLGDTVRLTPYPEVLEDAHHPPGMRIVARNTLLPSLNDEVVDGIAQAFGSGSMLLTLRSLGSAVARVGAYATAYAHRNSEVMLMAAIIMPADANDAQIDAALSDWKPLAARGSGPYLNFQGTATAADVAAAYPPPTYRRLSLVKRQYDPRNVFRRNHNVEPAEL